MWCKICQDLIDGVIRPKKPACDGYISAFDVLALFPFVLLLFVVSAGLSGLSSEFNQLGISQGGSEVLIPE